ncbi:MAG: biopolymer transporter ExbD [Steroidobacteraceae bacterium]|nr:biopolymer transporter ExbD [Steroidobacteraceae bacterium]
MAFGGLSENRSSRPVAEINMIPLIDVMLVLLVIFMVTAPLLTHAVKVNLPKASSTVDVSQRDSIHLSIDREGRVFWNGEAVVESDWRARMRQAADRDPQPELHINADGDIAYRRVMEVMSDAARAGLTRIGFVSDPRETR